MAKKSECEHVEFDWSLKKSDIVVDPEKAPALLSALKELGVDFKIADEDVETMIKEGGFFTNSQVMPLTRKGQMSDVHNIQFDRWNSLENVLFNYSLNYQILFLYPFFSLNRSTLG